MTPVVKSQRVGRVLRANTRGFTIGCEVLRPEIPAFGSFVRTERLEHGDETYGLIYDVSIEDDQFVRQFISARAPEEVVQDQRRNRQVPIEASILAIGCRVRGAIHHCLPSQPPVTLDWLVACAAEEIVTFTERLDYVRLVLEARDAPVDEVLAASLRTAAASRPESERRGFLIDAGREIARLLASDPTRLEGVLRRLRP